MVMCRHVQWSTVVICCMKPFMPIIISLLASVISRHIIILTHADTHNQTHGHACYSADTQLHMHAHVHTCAHTHTHMEKFHP